MQLHYVNIHGFHLANPNSWTVWSIGHSAVLSCSDAAQMKEPASTLLRIWNARCDRPLLLRSAQRLLSLLLLRGLQRSREAAHALHPPGGPQIQEHGDAGPEARLTQRQDEGLPSMRTVSAAA